MRGEGLILVIFKNHYISYLVRIAAEAERRQTFIEGYQFVEADPFDQIHQISL